MTRRSLFKTILTLLTGFSVSAGKTPLIIAVVARRCTGCKECLIVCPSGSIEMIRGKAEIDPDTCTSCRLCEAVCSYGAVEQCKKEQEEKKQEGDLGEYY